MLEVDWDGFLFVVISASSSVECKTTTPAFIIDTSFTAKRASFVFAFAVEMNGRIIFWQQSLIALTSFASLACIIVSFNENISAAKKTRFNRRITAAISD